MIEASVWFSFWIGTPSLASTAWCSPSDHRRPGMVLPVNSSTITTSRRSVTMYSTLRLKSECALNPRVDMVHQHDVGRVVEALARREQSLLDQQVLDLLVAVFGEKDLFRLLIHAEVTGAVLFFLPRQKGNQPVDPNVELRVLVGGAGYDERCPGLVDEDRVDLVHYREAERALHLVGGAEGHVVAEVVEPQLVVGAVDDIGGVGTSRFSAADWPGTTTPVRRPRNA